MAASLNAALPEQFKFVYGSTGIGALTTTVGDGDYVSMKNYNRLTIVILIDNSTTVTGTAITLLQADTVAGGNAKALAMTRMWADADVGASDALVKTAVTSDTFTTTAVNDKNALYIIEVLSSDLDIANGFDCVRVDGASAANSVGAVLYILDGSRYAGAPPPTAITD
jgi:hypothetical protein